MHSQTYGKILPKGSEHYAHHPIPAHPHLLRAGSQARGKISRFSAGAAVSCPHSLVPVASPCSSGLQLVLPQCSAPVPRGSMVTDGLLQGAGSFNLPALCGTYNVRCCIHRGLCRAQGVQSAPGRVQDVPQIIMRAFFYSTS